MSIPFRLGWLPDFPDYRDYTPGHSDVDPLLKKVRVAGTKRRKAVPNSTDLRAWCSPVEDQGYIGSCTAQAAVALVEYFERRVYGRHVEASRLFLYKATRNLMHLTGDTGAYLRSTMKAMVLFGVPPEEYWPYDPGQFDEEPPAFCYAYAQSYKTISYYRLDPAAISQAKLVTRIKDLLAAGLPSMFGFAVHSSMSQATDDGRIPCPSPGDTVIGGHAVAAVGYDDDLEIQNSAPGSEETVGAFLIRNSWGSNWGDGGYGWLPYEYVLRRYASDWWSLLSADWISDGDFSP